VCVCVCVHVGVGVNVSLSFSPSLCVCVCVRVGGTDVLARTCFSDLIECSSHAQSYTCPRKRRNSLQKFVRLVNDAGSSMINAFTRSSTVGHPAPGPASMPQVPSGLSTSGGPSAEAKLTSPLASTPVMSARALSRSQSEATSLLKGVCMDAFLYVCTDVRTYACVFVVAVTRVHGGPFMMTHTDTHAHRHTAFLPPFVSCFHTSQACVVPQRAR
jgi:hypothetical protein